MMTILQVPTHGGRTHALEAGGNYRHRRGGARYRQTALGLGVLLAASLITGCSTLATGTTHQLGIASHPSGALCQVSRDDKVIGRVNTTPGTLIVSKSVRDLTINCTLPGHQAGSQIVRADFEAATLGNLLIGGIVGVTIDAASGALGKYPPSTVVTLVPDEAMEPTEGRTGPTVPVSTLTSSNKPE